MIVLQGKCHCGAVEFQVDTAKGLHGLRRCDCSLCRRKGAIMATAPLEDLTVTKGEDKLSLYQWNTNVAKHYFCSLCGIYTHHRRRSDPNEFGFNVGCLENTDLNMIGAVEQTDGKFSSLVK
jgi:hypothetical protein